MWREFSKRYDETPFLLNTKFMEIVENDNGKALVITTDGTNYSLSESYEYVKTILYEENKKERCKCTK